MTISRRAILMGGLAILAACGAGVPAPMPRREPAMRAVANPAFDAWLRGYRGRAVARGIPAGVVDRALSIAGFLPGVVERDRNQTEFRRSLEDYLAIVANEEKVARGRAAFARHRGTLARIEERYGVEAEVVAAIWGVESDFGNRRGDIPVVSALATLAFDGRRGRFFEEQLDAALRIVARGDVAPERMTGSWAGAMGHTQFIPTSYQALAVDFDGDGRRDIWSDDPTDALASTANYLARSGWRRGEPWGVEDGGAQAPGGGRLIRPDPNGPAFRVYRNFDVIRRYNNSVNYAIGVGHLADRIGGAGPLRARFGPDATGLTIEDRRELQERLTARGFDTGGADGVIGSRTTNAIRAYEAANGLPVTGRPSRALLDRLR